MKHKAFMIATVALGLSGASRAATCTWTGAWDTTPSSTSDAIVVSSGGNLVWSNTLPQAVASWDQAGGYGGTVTFHTVYGTTGFTNFHIAGNAVINGGMWTHEDNSARTNRLKVSVGETFVLGSGAAIDASGLGYDAAKGDGRGMQNNGNWYQGASHGGLGGYGIVGTFQLPTTTYITYGSITMPEEIGSGGSVAGICGGGAIYLDIAGAATIDGAIRANAPYNNSINGTGGAGGSVFIRAGDISSAGAVIEAKGGVSAQAHGSSAGGGGGRIAVIVTNGASIDSDLTFDARGGTAYYLFQQAAAGTIYTETQPQSGGRGRLIIDNFNVFTDHDFAKTIYTPAFDYTNFSEIVIRNKGNLGIDGDDTFDFSTANLVVAGPTASVVTVASGSNVTCGANLVINGYTLVADGMTNVEGNLTLTNAVLTHSRLPDRDATERYRLRVTIGSNLTVCANARIDVTCKGFQSYQGPGGGNRNSPNQGGSYGGLGSLNGSPTAKYLTYGSIIAPTNNGSGCGGDSNVDTARNNGGGTVALDVRGDTTLMGSIRARAAGNTPNPTGSGGSLFLVTDSLFGSGTIDVTPEANVQANTYAHGGGGGRIAVILRVGNGFDGVTMAAYGGDGYENRDGAAGTIYRQTAAAGTGKGELVVDNNGLVPASNAVRTRISADLPDDLSGVMLIVTNKAVVELTEDLIVGNLLIFTNSSLVLSSYTLTVKSSEHNLANQTDSTPGPTNRVDHYDQIVWQPDSNGGTFFIIY